MSKRKAEGAGGGQGLDFASELGGYIATSIKSGITTREKPRRKITKDDLGGSNRGTAKRQARDEAAREGVLTRKEKHTQSRTALEKKARIYDALQRGDLDTTEVMKGQVLVDFDRKYQEYGRESPPREDPGMLLLPGELEEEEWVEVVDEFGRTRRVLKASLSPPPPPPVYGSEDEDEERVARFDSSKEVRNLGVGFYQFSRDEEKRREEQASLEAIRRETLAAQARSKTGSETGSKASTSEDKNNAPSSEEGRDKTADPTILQGIDDLLDSFHPK